jgi:CheY-like chemotaxis protein
MHNLGRILYAEDHQLVRKSTVRVLGALGYDVYDVSDGMAALNELKKDSSYDLVLSDIMMPQLGGVALASRMSEEFPMIPVLLVSGNASELECFEGPLPSQYCFLMKPFSADELSAALRNLLPPQK